ncbi:MAG: rRNA maturation RNase YbeY, partial [Rickettsiales bacterium]|nr:rRNA maturation RNase YbeY [Rickettsiales bacterium]
MTLDVTIHLKDPRWKSALRPYCKTVRETCEASLAETKLAKYACQWNLCVVLADDAFITELNRDWRGKNKPTNVLSFPAEDQIEAHAKALSREGEAELGDIILAFDTVAREAKAQNKTFAHHARHLIAHGFLHLIGHDHEDEGQAARMEK